MSCDPVANQEGKREESQGRILRVVSFFLVTRIQFYVTL
jgi:hypothetical protein